MKSVVEHVGIHLTWDTGTASIINTCSLFNVILKIFILIILIFYTDGCFDRLTALHLCSHPSCCKLYRCWQSLMSLVLSRFQVMYLRLFFPLFVVLCNILQAILIEAHDPTHAHMLVYVEPWLLLSGFLV